MGEVRKKPSLTEGKVVCVDPGKWAIAFSVWDKGALVGARYVAGDRLGMSLEVARYEPDLVLVEVPQVYPGPRKEDPNDLIQVALSAGACMSVCLRSITVAPHQWKGSVPKTIHNQRVMEKLSKEGRVIVDCWPPAIRHNVVDAIGLGQWAMSVEGQGVLGLLGGGS
jgi:hypothetical protein